MQLQKNYTAPETFKIIFLASPESDTTDQNPLQSHLKQVLYVLCSIAMSALTVRDPEPGPGGPGGPGGPWTPRPRPEPEPEVGPRC